MEKLKQYKYIILIVLVVLGFAFYWYEARPIIVRQNCYEEAKETVRNKYDERERKPLEKWRAMYDIYYQDCLRKKGLKINVKGFKK